MSPEHDRTPVPPWPKERMLHRWDTTLWGVIACAILFIGAPFLLRAFLYWIGWVDNPFLPD